MGEDGQSREQSIVCYSRWETLEQNLPCGDLLQKDKTCEIKSYSIQPRLTQIDYNIPISWILSGSPWKRRISRANPPEMVDSRLRKWDIKFSKATVVATIINGNISPMTKIIYRYKPIYNCQLGHNGRSWLGISAWMRSTEPHDMEPRGARECLFRIQEPSHQIHLRTVRLEKARDRSSEDKWIGSIYVFYILYMCVWVCS